MNPYVKFALKNSALSCAVVLFGALIISLLVGVDQEQLFWVMRSALFGVLTFFLVHNIFNLSAFFIPEKILSAGLVLYRALYSFVLKYLVLFAAFYLVLKFNLAHPAVYTAAFIASLCLNFVSMLMQSTKMN